jgi:hypothetical protein
MNVKVVTAAGLLSLMPFVALRAHHGRIGMFSDEPIQIEGVVSRVDWRNPHVYVFVNTVDETGENVEWMFANNSVSTMTRQGWTRDTLEVGDRITVQARPHNDPTNLHGSGASYTRSDGTRVGRANSDIRNELLESDSSSDDLFGIWVGLLDSFNLTNPPDWAENRAAVLTAGGEQFPNAARQEYAMEAVPFLNEKGRAALTRFDRNEPSNPWCTPWPVFPRTPGVILVEDRGDSIYMRDTYGSGRERAIYMDGRGHPEDGERTPMGHSVGQWEGDTLVIDTTLLADNPWGIGEGIPSGSQKHVIERYSLAEGGTRITAEWQLFDPEFMTGPFRDSRQWKYAPDLEQPEPGICSEEVGGRWLQGVVR